MARRQKVYRDERGVIVNRKKRRALLSKKNRVYNSVIDANVVPHHHGANPIGYDVEKGIATAKFRTNDLICDYMHATKGRRTVPQIVVIRTYERAGVRV